MEATSTPPITCPYLDSYVGQNVRVVGKVAQLRGDTAVIDADGNITANLHRVCPSSPPISPTSPLSRPVYASPGSPFPATFCCSQGLGGGGSRA